jgi:hypothetical protein
VPPVKRRPVRPTVAPGTAAARALAASIAASTRPVGGIACRVCSLPGAVRTVVDQTLAVPVSQRRVSLPQLGSELKKIGYDVGTSSLQKHATRHVSR